MLLAIGYYLHLRAAVIAASPETTFRNPRCPQDLALLDQLRNSLLSYDALLVLMAAYTAYFLAKICGHLAEMITAPVPTPETDADKKSY